MTINWTTILTVVGVLALLGVCVWQGRSQAEIAGIATVCTLVVSQLAPAVRKDVAP